jgi:signal transduction histidine kinase
MLTPGNHATLLVMRERELQKGELAALAAAAHELKSPLALVQSIAQTLGDAELQLTDQDRARYLSRLQFTSDRMLRLVNQLALSYRLDDESQLAFQFQLEPLSALEVCETVAHELVPYAKAYNQELRVQNVARPQLVVANRDILHDIIVNLADNAIRHNPQGGVVDISAATRGAQVRVSVHDQGGGIAKAELARLRKTLGTQPQPLSGRSATSGLGLYIVGQFAQAMGGTLGLGRPGQGTHLFVDLLRSKQMNLL